MNTESLENTEISEKARQKYLTAKQAAEYLGVGNSTALSLWRKRDYGPPYIRLKTRIGKPRYLYQVEDLDKWMEENKLYPQNPHEMRPQPPPAQKTERPKRSYTRKKPKPALDPHLVFRTVDRKPR